MVRGTATTDGQVLPCVPDSLRAAALFLGLTRPDAARFSFLLGIPAIGAAGHRHARAVHDDERDETSAWAPSALFAVAEEVVSGAVEGPVHVRGRVVDTGSSRGGTQFVTLVDEDVTARSWDTPRLGLVVFAWRARWLERPLGGPVSEALTTGTVVDAVGELGIAPGDALRRRIVAEDWVGQRPPLPPVLRRVGALISVAGDGDLDEALRLVEHDALAPAFCRHRIHPLSSTAVLDVPALLDHHVRAGVDAVLIAFGGHLPPVSAWDAEPVLEAIHRAHLAGVPVVAGFAHGRDQPLTKLVAHNHAQASAAVTALVQHNHRLLGRLAPALSATLGQAEAAEVRQRDHAVATLRRVRATPTSIARRTTRAARTEVERVAALGDPGAALTTRLATTLATTRVRAGHRRRRQPAARVRPRARQPRPDHDRNDHLRRHRRRGGTQ